MIHKFDEETAKRLLECRAEAAHKIDLANAELVGAMRLAGKLAGFENGKLLDDCSGIEGPDPPKNGE
jgi:hypothetical protein